MILVGIDPGVKTGFAVWNAGKSSHFERVETLTILDAMEALDELLRTHGNNVAVRFEDASKRKWFGTKGREALQGAGSIKRDCAIWREYCEKRGVSYQAVAPSAGNTKWDADKFARLTGWKGRTSEHARDAALLVFGLGGIVTKRGVTK